MGSAKIQLKLVPLTYTTYLWDGLLYLRVIYLEYSILHTSYYVLDLVTDKFQQNRPKVRQTLYVGIEYI